VLETALELYLQAHLELRVVCAAAIEAQRDLRSGAVPMLSITEEDPSREQVPERDEQATATPPA
jgi:hypothetical protein